MTDYKFNVGDQVRLKEGGYTATVVDISHNAYDNSPVCLLDRDLSDGFSTTPSWNEDRLEHA